MANLWLKIRIWTKLVLFALIVTYLLMFTFKNIDQPVALWLFPYKKVEGMSVLLLLLTTFFLGVIVTLSVRTIFKTLRQIREARERGKAAQLERDVADMKAKAAKLQTREETGSEPQA